MENPVIERIERYGYPEVERTYTCPKCGSTLYEGDDVWTEGGDIEICEHCLEKLIKKEAWEVFNA